MKIMGVVLIGIVAMSFILMYTYSQQSLGASDMNVNLSGTQYQTAYNDSVNMSKIGFSYMGQIPIFLGVAGLLAALVMLFAAVKFRA